MINDNFYKKLGINIKNRRLELGLTQQELADASGLSLNFVGKIEVAFAKPSMDSIISIANVLKISVSELCKF